GVGDDGLLRAFDEVIAPAARRYRPELLLISAGYDAHWTNTRYLSSIRMAVSVAGFAELVRRLRALAQELCVGRLAMVLECGYDPEALGWSVAATLNVLLDRPAADPLGLAHADEEVPDITGVLTATRQLHGLA